MRDHTIYSIAIELIDSIMKKRMHRSIRVLTIARLTKKKKKYLRKKWTNEGGGEGTRYRFIVIVHRSWFAIRLNTRVETMFDNSRGLLIDAVTPATVCNPKCCRGHAVATCARRWQDHQLGELIAQQKYQETKSTARCRRAARNVTRDIVMRDTARAGWWVVRWKRVRKRWDWGWGGEFSYPRYSLQRVNVSRRWESMQAESFNPFFSCLVLRHQKSQGHRKKTCFSWSIRW